jgi:predicted lysophospholipase L1 biosynthesis ABC-type transport system permease subunit
MVGAVPPDAHSRGADLRRTQWLGWLGSAAAFAGLILGVTAVARRSLASQAATVRLLRSLGAGDTQVSGQFEERAARAALAGAAVGFVIAIGVLAMLGLPGRIWPDAGMIEPRLTPAHWLRLIAVPVAGGLLAGWVARLTVRFGLTRLH